ncbi:MAG: 30S ribosomal protein S20 [Patescibacteria group bacterium]
MPNIKGAKKALRQNKRRYTKNAAQKNILKKTIRQYRKLVDQKNLDEAKKSLPTVYKKLDKAAKANLIKKNKASRLKSRLSKKLQSQSAPSHNPTSPT